MPTINVASQWSSGNLIFKERSTGNGAQLIFGTNGDGLDVKYYFETSNASVLFDESADYVLFGAVGLQMKDNSKISIGTGAGTSGDAQLYHDGTNIILAATADDTLIEIGDSAATQLSFDLKWYGDTASGTSYVYFDASANLVYTQAVDLQFKDSDYLVFGTGAGATGDVNVTFDGTTLIFTTTTDDILWEIGDSAATQKSLDVKWYANESNGASYLYADASANLIYTTGVDLQFKDSDYLVIGTGSGATGDVNITWDGTNMIISAVADDTLIEIGDSAGTQLSFDLKWYGDTASGTSYVYFDASANLVYTQAVDLQFKDSDYLVFGTGAGATGDLKMTHDGTNFVISATADDTLIEIGDSAGTQLSFDVKWYGNENSGASYLYFDASENNIYTTGVDLQFKDNDKLTIGTGAGAAGDAQLYGEGTGVLLAATADDTVLEIGDSAATQLSFDVIIYGDAANGADYLKWDASASALTLTGAAALLLGRHKITKHLTKTSSYTVLSTDTGTMFNTVGAATLTFTLPTLATGLHFYFFNAVDKDMHVKSQAGNDIVGFNDATATTLSFETASEKIGAAVEMFCDGTYWYGITSGKHTVTVT